MWKPVILLFLAVPFLGACERYTEQTSPCFGRGGKPVVSRAAFSFVAPVVQPATEAAENMSAKDCDFKELPRPV